MVFMEDIRGKVREGRGVGATIGYPTLNIPYDGDKRGIYVGKVLLRAGEGGDGGYPAAIHLGPRPTFDDSEVVCEAFLIDWEGKVEVGIEIQVKLVKKNRNIQKFENLEELKDQISKDVEFAKNWYNSNRN